MSEQQDLQRCAHALRAGGMQLLERVFCAVLSDRGASLEEARAFGIKLRDDLSAKGLLPAASRSFSGFDFAAGVDQTFWWFNDGSGRWRRM